MAPPSPSLTAARTGVPAGATLADLLAAVAASGLPGRRRHDMASAVRTVARLIGRGPAEVPAAPRLLAGRLAEIAPAAHGISQGRWNNIRSLLRASLALLGPVAPGRHLGGLSPAWRTHWDRIACRRVRMGLSRFLRFCSAEGVEPAAVDAAVFERFRAGLEASLLKSPEATLRGTRRAWRLARRQGYTLPWSAFPESLRRDAQGWLDRLAGRDPLDEIAFRPVCAGTVAMRDRQLRAFASALVHRGRGAGELRGLADLVQVEALKQGLRFFLDRRGGRSSTAIADLAATLKAVARHWVRVPPAHLDRIAALERRLEVPSRGLTETNRARLRQFDDRDNALALLHLPARLLASADRAPPRQRRRAALLVQQALAIELLLMAPIRVGNLAALDLERHLVRPNRARGAVHLVVAAEQVKNREPLEFPLPPPTVALLERYRAEFRPLLAPPGSTALFPGRGGAPKTRHGLGLRISRTVFAHTGLRVHPHLFRHIAAKLFLDAHPGAYEVVRRVLGHRSLETTTGFYTGLETAAAVRHFDETILRLRGGAGARA